MKFCTPVSENFPWFVGEPRQIDTLEMLKKSKAKFRETLLSTKVQDSKHDTDENDEDDEDSGW